MYIPGGCTGLCQVMDVALNKPFKGAIRNFYLNWRAAQIKTNQTFVSPDRPLVIGWVLDSWTALDNEVVRSAMMKHVVLPALTIGPLPRLPDDHRPEPPEQEPEAEMGILDDLALPPQELQDGTGMVEAEGPPDQDSSSSEEEDEAEPTPPPTDCVLCQQPMREKNRIQCAFCKAWFHPGCASTGSNGKCRLCP